MVFVRSLSSQLRRPASSFLSTAAKGPSPIGARAFSASTRAQSKVLLCLYDVSDANAHSTPHTLSPLFP